jgi:hypothetical protein
MGRPCAGFTFTHTAITIEDRWFSSYTISTDVIFPLDIWPQHIGISDEESSTRVLEDKEGMPSHSSKEIISLASTMSSHACMQSSSNINTMGFNNQPHFI